MLVPHEGMKVVGERKSRIISLDVVALLWHFQHKTNLKDTVFGWWTSLGTNIEYKSITQTVHKLVKFPKEQMDISWHIVEVGNYSNLQFTEISLVEQLPLISFPANWWVRSQFETRCPSPLHRRGREAQEGGCPRRHARVVLVTAIWAWVVISWSWEYPVPSRICTSVGVCVKPSSLVNREI